MGNVKSKNKTNVKSIVINKDHLYCRNGEYIKLMIVGDTLSGKSQLSNNISNKKFNNKYIRTIGFDFQNASNFLHNKIVLQIIDISGNAKSDLIKALVTNHVKIIMLVFDLTDKESFDNIIVWNKIIENTSNNHLKFLIGNKSDLQHVCISQNEIEKLSRQINSIYFEVSAKNGSGISDIQDYLDSTIIVN